LEGRKTTVLKKKGVTGGQAKTGEKTTSLPRKNGNTRVRNGGDKREEITKKSSRKGTTWTMGIRDMGDAAGKKKREKGRRGLKGGQKLLHQLYYMKDCINDDSEEMSWGTIKNRYERRGQLNLGGTGSREVDP